MTSDENELSEACIKTLTVNIDHTHTWCTWKIATNVKKKIQCYEQQTMNINVEFFLYVCLFFLVLCAI